MARSTMMIAGLEFQQGDDEWTTTRPFPHLLKTKSATLAVEGKGEPTPGQIAAIEGFLKDEQAICSSLLETVVRYIKVRRKEDPDWFEDIPVVRSTGSLGKLLEFSGIMALRKEHEGQSLLGFGFSCEWDPEHDFGMALWNGQVVDIGPAEVSFDPQGLMISPGILQGDQIAASQAIFGAAVREQTDRMQLAMEAFRKRQQDELLRAASRSDLGPAVREFSRLLLEHSNCMLQVTFDLNTSQPSAPPALDPGITDLLSKLESQQGMGAGLANLMRGFAEQAAQPASSTIELSINLPTDFVMWNYSGSLGTKRLESGIWPNALYEPLEEWPEAKPRLESVVILKPSGGKMQALKNSPLQAAAVAALAEIYER